MDGHADIFSCPEILKEINKYCKICQRFVEAVLFSSIFMTEIMVHKTHLKLENSEANLRKVNRRLSL